MQDEALLQLLQPAALPVVNRPLLGILLLGLVLRKHRSEVALVLH